MTIWFCNSCCCASSVTLAVVNDFNDADDFNVALFNVTLFDVVLFDVALFNVAIC